MGKCNNCGKKIEYNRYKMYRGKVLCPECYDTRLERKAAKKAELKKQAELIKIVTPKRKARKRAKKLGVTTDVIPDIYGGNDESKAEDSD